MYVFDVAQHSTSKYVLLSRSLMLIVCTLRYHDKFLSPFFSPAGINNHVKLIVHSAKRNITSEGEIYCQFCALGWRPYHQLETPPLNIRHGVSG